MITKRQFLNRLLSMYNIDGDLLPELTKDEQRSFVRDPINYFIRFASDEQQIAISREIERRQPENRLPPGTIPPQEPLSAEGEATLAKHLSRELPG